MVPAWAAVAIALGSAAFGAFAGVFGGYISLRIARLNVDHQVAEAWRTRQLEAAEEFSAAWTATISHVGIVRETVVKGGERGAVLNALREKHAEAGAKLMRVGLLFGVESMARDFARDALSAANIASAALEDLSDPEEAVKQCNHHLTRSQGVHRDFVRVAHGELSRVATREGQRRSGPLAKRRRMRARAQDGETEAV